MRHAGIGDGAGGLIDVVLVGIELGHAHDEAHCGAGADRSRRTGGRRGLGSQRPTSSVTFVSTRHRLRVSRADERAEPGLAARRIRSDRGAPAWQFPGTTAAGKLRCRFWLVRVWRRQGDLITRSPFNEWTFTHTKWLLPTETVRRGAASRPLPRRLRALELIYRFEDREYSLADLHRTFTTAFVVLHRGAVIHESYPGMFAGPGVRFQLFSLTKSVTSILIDIALADRVISSLDDPVTEYRGDFAGTAYDGPTIGDLLDMSSGVGDLESWDLPDSDIKRFEQPVLGGGNLEEVVRSAHRTAAPRRQAEDHLEPSRTPARSRTGHAWPGQRPPGAGRHRHRTGRLRRS
jgi:beta-lactamase family protein